MDAASFERWVEDYRRAWESNDPRDIGGLFTDDAAYSTEPYAEPWRGRAEIVRRWLEQKDEPGNTDFRYEVIATTGDLGIVKGWTKYKDPPREYANLWEVRLDDGGRCREFTEWWMEKKTG